MHKCLSGKDVLAELKKVPWEKETQRQSTEKQTSQIKHSPELNFFFFNSDNCFRRPKLCHVQFTQPLWGYRIRIDRLYCSYMGVLRFLHSFLLCKYCTWTLKVSDRRDIFLNFQSSVISGSWLQLWSVINLGPAA